MNVAQVESITNEMHSQSLVLSNLLGEVRSLLVQRAAQVEAQRRGLEVGGTYLIRKPGKPARRIVVRWIGGTAEKLRVRYDKRPHKRIFIVVVTPDMGVVRIS